MKGCGASPAGIPEPQEGALFKTFPTFHRITTANTRNPGTALPSRLKSPRCLSPFRRVGGGFFFRKQQINTHTI